jgi:hypothetical protein
MPSFVTLLIATLAVWRFSHLVVAEDGPWAMVATARAWAARSMLGALMECFSCVSLVVSAPVAWWLADRWPEGVLIWFGLSGGAMIGQRLAARVSAGALVVAETGPAAPSRATVALADVATGRRAAAVSDLRPVEPGWTGATVGRAAVGIIRHVDDAARRAIDASGPRAVRGKRPESASALGEGFTDREVPRPPSVTPLADRVRAADDLFDPRRHTPPRPAFDGTIWQ